jgi:hypothetical protein
MTMGELLAELMLEMQSRSGQGYAGGMTEGELEAIRQEAAKRRAKKNVITPA